MDTLGQRLQKALDARGKTAVWLIEVTGKSKQTIYNILEDATKPDTCSWGTAAQICLALRVSPDWLRTGRGAMDRDGEDGWTDIAAYRTAASLGDGAAPDEYAETHALKFRVDSLRKKRLRPDVLGVVYGRGDSMLPRIRSGDAILFDRSDTDPKDGHIYVITYDGDLLAKRLIFMGDRWWVESLNRDDPKWQRPRPIDEVKQFKVHGRVRWIGSWEG